MECAICQDELSQYVAKPSGCTHYFHEYCLSKWKFKTCPSCRSSYDVFEVLDLEKNMVLTRITAMSPNREDLEAIQEDFPVGIPDPFIDLVCDVCNSGHDDHTLLICDGCSKGFHLNCVHLNRVPRTRSWYCIGCEPILRRPPPQERPRNRRGMQNFIYDGHDSLNEESELEDEFDEEDSDRSQASLESFIDDRYASEDEEDSVLARNVIDMILPTVGRRARGARRASTSGRGTRRGGTRRRPATTRRTRRRRTSTTRGGGRRRRRATRGHTRSSGQTTMEEYFRPHNDEIEDNIDLMDVLPTIREEVETKYELKREIIDSYDLLGEILPQQEIALTPGHLLKIEGEKFVPRPEWNTYIEKKRSKHEKSVKESIRRLPPPPANIFTITLVTNGSSSQNIDVNGTGSSQNCSSNRDLNRPRSDEKRRHRDESNIPQTSHSSRTRTRSPPRKQCKTETGSPSDVKKELCEAEDTKPSTSRTTHEADRNRESDTKPIDSKRRHGERRHESREQSNREGSSRSVSGATPDKRTSTRTTKENKPRSISNNRDDESRSTENRNSRPEKSGETSNSKERRDGAGQMNTRRKSNEKEHRNSVKRSRTETQSNSNSDEQQLHKMALIQMELNRKIEAEQHLMAMNQLAMQVSMEKTDASGTNRPDSEAVRKEKQDLINFYDSIGKPEMKKLFQAKRITGDQYKNAMRLIVEKCRAKSVPLNDSKQVRHIVQKVREKILRPASS